MTKEVYAVNTTEVVPVETLEVIHESDDMYLLNNKALLNKKHMGDAKHLYFTDRALAEKVASYVKMSCFAVPKLTNMQTIMNCADPASLALILFKMIQELCEDGMPTHECIEEYLNSPAREEEKQTEEDTYGLEEYDTLKQGDTMFYIDHHKNVQRGRVFKISRGENGRISYISVDAPNDFLGIGGENLGKTLFIREHVATFISQQ